MDNESSGFLEIRRGKGERIQERSINYVSAY